MAFAEDLSLAADVAAGASDVLTDAAPMDGANRVSSVLHIEYIYGTNATLTLHLQGSNGRRNFVDIDATSKGAAGAYAISAASAPFAYVRYQAILTVSAGSGAACVDLRARVDRE